MNGVWNPATWRSRPAAQMPVYADAAALGAVEAELAGGDPVVGIDGIEALAAGLAEISAGRALLLQGGDCAETFAEPDIPALTGLFDRLDPKREPGRLTLIIRHGAGEIGRRLPALVQAVRKAGRAPVWLCDPMHGNTERLNGAKRRLIEHIRAEVADFAAILRSENSWAGGLHLEMTAEAVEECGSTPGRSTTACDPRLNSSQALGVVAAFSSAFAQQAAA